MIRLYRAPFSTNVERVALALAHKGIEAESVVIDYADRSPVIEVSGQGLVPVVTDDGEVVADSTAILRHLERRYPEPPLFPADPARRAELSVFLEWFNEVWKTAPNAIDEELEQPEPDRERIAVESARMRAGWTCSRTSWMGATISSATSRPPTAPPSPSSSAASCRRSRRTTSAFTPSSTSTYGWTAATPGSPRGSGAWTSGRGSRGD